MSSVTRKRGSSRRDFLKGVGAAGAGLVAAGGVAAPPAGANAAPGPISPHGYAKSGSGAPASSVDFGRMFPQLPPFADATDTVRSALLAVGQQGGILDANDQLSQGPKNLILTPGVNGNPTATNPYGTNPDNPTMTAGSTFVGQFIDHDITFDQTSQLGVSQDPLTSPNTRTPALDLDSVFGGGPGLRPDLYVQNADGTVGPKLKIGSGGVHEDVPRVPNGDGTYNTLLGDPRNDEHVIIAGLHCAHIMFYNRVLDELGSFDLAHFPAAKNADMSNSYIQFLNARQVTLWHYQWLLVNEHLPQIAGQAVVNDVLKKGNRFYKPPRGDAFMPIEFGAAAYRFGHSMVRPSYRANFTNGTGDSTNPAADPFFALVFDPTQSPFDGPVTTDRDDLLGGFPAPNRYVGWQTFFDFGDGQVKNNKKIDTTISSVLFTLPLPAIAPHTQTSPTVLPQRNLMRQLTWGLPSGQAVAQAMGVSALGPSDLPDITSIYAPFGSSTPLWYYVLAEAKAVNNGLNLGPVGGRIVAETLIGLLRGDPSSYLSAYPQFTPFLGTDLSLGPNPNPNITGNRTYTRAHFLYYARVVTPGIYR
ncbi:MAG TPA: peroxidase family protein [Solirubrobacteraceae bacterium]|nr:peroxidase family protein [Solirubrobacteraceae bacterium]